MANVPISAKLLIKLAILTTCLFVERKLCADIIRSSTRSDAHKVGSVLFQHYFFCVPRISASSSAVTPHVRLYTVNSVPALE